MASSPAARPFPRGHLSLLGALALAAVSLLFGLAWFADDATERRMAERAVAVAASLRGEIDLLAAERVFDALPEAGSVHDWAGHGDALGRLHRQLAEAADRHGLRRLRMVTPPHPGARGTSETGSAPMQLLVSAGPPRWRAPVTTPAAMRAVWSSGIPAGERTTTAGTTEFAHWTPLYDSAGRTFALLESRVDISGPSTEARLGAVRVGFLPVLALGMTALMIAGAHARRRRDLEEVRKVLGRWAGGDIDAGPFLPSETEVAALVRDLEIARAAIAERSAEQSQRIEAMRAQLAAAEAAVGGDAPSRRLGIAAAGGARSVTVDCGAGEPVVADLLDLDFEHAVVRVPRFAAVDVVPGMPLALGWSSGDVAPVELFVRRRTETQEGVDYVLAVSPPRALDGSPPAIARLAYARSAPRLQLGKGGPTGVLMAGLNGPLEVRILDLSIEGACLAVPATPADLATTGTSAALAIRLEEGAPELVVGILLRNVRARPGGCELGVRLDTIEAPDQADVRARLGSWIERARDTEPGHGAVARVA